MQAKAMAYFLWISTRFSMALSLQELGLLSSGHAALTGRWTCVTSSGGRGPSVDLHGFSSPARASGGGTRAVSVHPPTQGPLHGIEGFVPHSSRGTPGQRPLQPLAESASWSVDISRSPRRSWSQRPARRCWRSPGWEGTAPRTPPAGTHPLGFLGTSRTTPLLRVRKRSV